MTSRIKGVDISAWQKGIDFSRLAEAGVRFAIIRAGCGKIKDGQVDIFVENCKKWHISYGFYWYSYALTVDRAKEEAEKCLEVIKDCRPDYPVYFDMEDKSQISGLTSRERTDMCHAFCETIRAAGYTAGVYANPSWFNNYLIKSELIGNYEIWLAHWTEDASKPSSYNAGQKVWQWGLDNIDGMNVDGDIAFYDYAAAEIPDEEPPTIPETFEIGDIVRFKGGPHYVSSFAEKPSGRIRSAGAAKIQNVSENAPHKYALVPIEGGSDVYGWVDEGLVESRKEETQFMVGDRVRVKNGAKDYKGRGLASFVYTITYEVLEIGCGVAVDYIVIGTGGQVTAALHADDLIKQGDIFRL